MTQQTVSVKPAARPTRLHYLDNLRFALTILVIFHHTAIAYGGAGNWAYRSRHHSQSLVLVAFNALAQSFFMGTFFFLSGIFSRITRQRKGYWSFVKDKLFRLILPSIVYTLTAAPLQDVTLGVFLHRSKPSPSAVRNHFTALWDAPGIRGPVWYPVLLCIFDCFYASGISLREAICTRKAKFSEEEKPSATLLHSIDTPSCIAAILACGIISFLVRLRFPTTSVFQLLNLRIGFVPQYIGLYIFGLNVDPNKIDLLPRGGLRAHLAIIIAVLAVYVKFNLNGPIGSLLEDHSGGLNSTAATYAILNEFVGYLLLATAFTQFRSHFNSSCGAVTTVSYAMFLVHPPVSVAVEVVTDDWKERALPKTAVIGFINSMFSVVAGWLLKQLPGAGKVL